MLEVVLPDTGPLISLGLLGTLDLIQRFDCAVLVTDMVKYEALRGDEDMPDRLVIESWLERGTNQVQVVETTYGLMYQALPPDMQKKIRLRKGAGENSIREFAQHVRETLPPDGQALVIFEDQRVPSMDFGKHVHLLHTFAFLRTLENMGVIPSASDLVDELRAKERDLARDLFERPAKTEEDGDADWTSSFSGLGR